jgi:peptide/nickel transport system permease protein
VDNRADGENTSIINSIDSRRISSTRKSGYYRRAIRRFFSHKLGILAFIVLCLFILITLLAPFISPYEPNKVNTNEIRKAPSKEHWFGTDELGRDILTRVIYGSRITLLVMTGSIIIALILGIIIGLVSGYIGGLVDTVIMRFMDAILAFPSLVLALAIISILGPGVEKAIIAISIINIPAFARLVRGQVLSNKELEYVKAARSVGYGNFHILFREIAPNSLDSVIIFASLRSAIAILTESALSFLGLGVQPPTPSWGFMVSMGLKYWNAGWWISFFPGLAIFIVVLSINLVGDALRDSFDVKIRI